MNNYEIQDNISPFFKKLSDIAPGLANQALNKSGAAIQKRMASKSRSLGSHTMGQRFEKGRRLLNSSKRNRGSKNYYSRYSKITGAKKSVDMGDLIRFKLYPITSVMLVGWINTKGFSSLSYNGGIASRGTYVKGTKTKAIARKMADGGRENLTASQKKLFLASGWRDAAKKGYVTRKPHRFMTFASYLNVANEVAQKEFKKATKEFYLKAA